LGIWKGWNVILDILSLVLLLSALFSAWVTYRIVHDHLSTPSQRVAQAILVWLLPALGAMIVLHMQRQNPEPSTGKYREPPDPGDDFGMSARSVRNFKEVIERSSPNSGGVDSD
jgi:hypothetical protein